ncbi:hypothetical protein MJH12_13930 [bacterium]|nr:hypothetical protein [bacterium]
MDKPQVTQDISIDLVNAHELHVHSDLMRFSGQCISCQADADTSIHSSITHLPSYFMGSFFGQAQLENRLSICKTCKKQLDLVNSAMGLTTISIIGSLLWFFASSAMMNNGMLWAMSIPFVFIAFPYLLELYDRSLNWRVLNFSLKLKDKEAKVIVFQHKNPMVLQESLRRAKLLLE